jgi:selenide,water dikinase
MPKTRKSVAKRSSAPIDVPKLALDTVGGGCAAKLGAGELAKIVAGLPVQRHRDLLVGCENFDDAGVYRLRSDLALVTTVDFFPPMVDDPYEFGRIAAANAMSDVYAMGGRPLTALNLVMYSSDVVPAEVLAAVLAGGAERAAAAGVVVAGGHSVCDRELKYGMAVTGVVHPKRIVRNGGARAGDVVVLTKPLGTGILATGIKRGAVEDSEEQAAIASMVALNDIAASLLLQYRARACTDVTGFGLAGHAAEMVRASSGVRLEIEGAAIPLLPGTARLAEAGFTTAGARRTQSFLGRRLVVSSDVAPGVAEAVLDPQTSGGLLVSLPARQAPGYVEALHACGLRPAVIGRVAARSARSSSEVVVE